MAVWKAIPGYPHYMASDDGRIFSTYQNRELTQCRNQKGYMTVHVKEGNQYPKRYVHRLVAFAFLGLPENETLQINHIDENKSNNAVNNLEWVTPHENLTHGTRIKRFAKSRGKPVKNIDTGVSYYCAAEACRQTGIHRGLIGRVCKGKSKTAGGYRWEYQSS